MPDEKKLHERMEALEKRLSAARADLAAMSDPQRASLEAALEKISEAVDDFDRDEKG